MWDIPRLTLEEKKRLVDGYILMNISETQTISPEEYQKDVIEMKEKRTKWEEDQENGIVDNLPPRKKR